MAKISHSLVHEIKNFLPTSTLLCVFYSLVHSHLSYGIIIWGSTYRSNLEKLTSLQNKAIRAVGSAECNENSCPLYYQFKVLKLYDMNKYELAKFVHHLENKPLLTPSMNFFATVKSD